MNNGNLKDCVFHNLQVQQLAQESYDLPSLDRLFNILTNTLFLHRFTQGGHWAVTPMFDANAANPFLTVEAAQSTRLDRHWNRDSIMQAVAERALIKHPLWAEKLKVPKDAYRRGLLFDIGHHLRYQSRFTKIITGKATGFDFMERPHIRFHAIDGDEFSEYWPHAQNDGLGAVHWFLWFCTNRELSADNTIQYKGKAFSALLHHFWYAVHVWEDWDMGAWEDKKAEHASSIAMALVSLREQLKWMVDHSACFSYSSDNRSYEVTIKGVRQLLSKCEGRLKEILPSEFIRSEDKSIRRSDSALINPLFLAALSGQPLVDDEMTIKIIDAIEKDLMGKHGVMRYRGDIWDGIVNRPGVPEAQWTHPHPMLSSIFGELYRRTGNASYRQRQLFHFNRALATVNERFHVPEAYVARWDGNNWQWNSDSNESLAWSQAMLVMAFIGMKETIGHDEKAVVAPVRTSLPAPTSASTPAPTLSPPPTQATPASVVAAETKTAS